MVSPAVASSVMQNYFAFVAVIAVALTITTAILLLNHLLGQRSPTTAPAIKGQSYECGVGQKGDSHQPFAVRYYLVALTFLLFDVDVAIIYPWALIYRRMLAQGPMILIEMLIFVAILVAGYLYVRGRGGLDWE